MANEQKRRRIINSRNAPKSGKTFGGSSVSSTPKDSLMNKTGTYRVPSQVTKPDTKFSAKPTPKGPTPEVKFGNTAEKEMRSAANATRGATSKVAELSKTALANKDILKGAGRAATGLGRAAMLEAGPAIAATVLAGSADKYGRERGFGFQTRDVPKSSMSKKSDPIVDAINAEPKSKAVTAVASKSEGTSPRTDYKPLKDMVSVKEAPAVSKPALKSGVSKPKGPTEGDRARAAIESMRSQYESGDLYNKVGLEKSAEDENARTKTEATEALKKGGMTKRPPKPAKKVPARKFASGGSTSRTSASKRGDGCATKGHTKGVYR